MLQTQGSASLRCPVLRAHPKWNLVLNSAGIVEEVGSDVPQWKPGDAVMALLSGGGYAQYAAVPCGQVAKVPKGYTMEEAAGVMEAYATTYQSLMWLGKVAKGENVLIHGGASGIGTSAIRLAKTIPGVKVFATAGTDEKCKLCESLGADMAINYKTTPNFAEAILAATKGDSTGPGVDFVLDFIGQQYLQQNLTVLRQDGRLVYLAMLSGSVVDNVNLGPILSKRLSILGTTLRSRTHEYKEQLVTELAAYASHLLEDGTLKPVIDKTYNWTQVAEAHESVEKNMNLGKVILNGM